MYTNEYWSDSFSGHYTVVHHQKSFTISSIQRKSPSIYLLHIVNCELPVSSSCYIEENCDCRSDFHFVCFGLRRTNFSCTHNSFQQERSFDMEFRNRRCRNHRCFIVFFNARNWNEQSTDAVADDFSATPRTLYILSNFK